MSPPNNVFPDPAYPNGDSAPSSPYDILYPSLVQARANQAQNAANQPTPAADP